VPVPVPGRRTSRRVAPYRRLEEEDVFTRHKRRWQLSKVKPGDGSRRQKYHFWQLFFRSLFDLELQDQTGSHLYEVDVRHMANSTTRTSPTSLYRDGIQIHRANLPVTFPLPGGVIEVATSQYGVKRMHLVRDDGAEHVLRPHPRSQEGLRARFGERLLRTSTVIGAVAVAVLLAVMAVGVLTGLEALTRIEIIAQHTGAFTSRSTSPDG
jgi:hypothetical protein